MDQSPHQVVRSGGSHRPACLRERHQRDHGVRFAGQLRNRQHVCHVAPLSYHLGFAKETYMPAIHESTLCPQCGDTQAELDADCSGSHRTTCLICGYREREGLKFDSDGVLRYRHVDDNFFTNYFLRSTRETLDAERWLRRMLRRGAVDADTARLTRWSDDLNRVEVLAGE